jgi:hypothetical protein
MNYSISGKNDNFSNHNKVYLSQVSAAWKNLFGHLRKRDGWVDAVYHERVCYIPMKISINRAGYSNLYLFYHIPPQGFVPRFGIFLQIAQV